MTPCIKIVSGGQTGADRAALDWAISAGVAHGGWCPNGRKAEDGPIAECYKLTESRSQDYVQRTEWNVRDSDGTVILTLRPLLTGGSKKTASFAAKHRKPCLHLSAEEPVESCAARLSEFLQANKVQTLNVAGSRAS